MIKNFKIFETYYKNNTYILVNSDAIGLYMIPMKILDYNGVFYRCKNLITNINHHIADYEIIKEISYDEVQLLLTTNKYNL